MIKLVIISILGLLTSFTPSVSEALSILPTDFWGNEVIEEFDDAVPPSPPPGGVTGQSSPLVLNGITYSTSTSLMQIFNGTYVFSLESAIGTDSSSGYIDAVFDTPVLRAGGWVGASGARADFFAENNYFLGSTMSSHFVS
jgi:hypothetical protein